MTLGNLTQKEIVQHIVQSYTPTDQNFAQNALQYLNDYFDELPDSTISRRDPTRIRGRTKLVSNAKNLILEGLPSIKIGKHIFDKLSTIKEQLLFQKESIKNDTNRWIHSYQILPNNLVDFHLDPEIYNEKQRMKEEALEEKLDDGITINQGDAFLARVLENLSSDSILTKVVPALLLATGRRTTEIMKTARFYLKRGGKRDGYKCWFSGQLKSGVSHREDYQIPLLAPFHLVKSALEKVRELYDTQDEKNEDVSKKYSSRIGTACYNLTNYRPHQLRGIYSICCFQLFAGRGRVSQIGYVSKILGDTMGSSVAYTTYRINNLTGPYSQ